ncbi:MAG: hypothetical protein MJZ79_04085 [Paludibacteraceae bacterium]|nr:hypothetical protein [Paludibacteraceae bacterium]
MKTHKYICREMDMRGYDTSIKEIEETYTDLGKICKQHIVDHVCHTTEECINQTDSLGQVVDADNELFSYYTKKDSKGRFIVIEQTNKQWHQIVYRTTISYYPNSNLVYKKVTEYQDCQQEETYIYFDSITQIERLTHYKDNTKNDERVTILQDAYREFYIVYNVASNRIVTKGFNRFKGIYSYLVYFDENDEKHTSITREERISEYETHTNTYEDGVLTYQEVQFDFFSQDKKTRWSMMKTIDYESNNETMCGFTITRNLD